MTRRWSYSVATWLTLLATGPALGQATGQSSVSHPVRQAGAAPRWQRPLPQPVRPADHLEPIEESVVLARPGSPSSPLPMTMTATGVSLPYQHGLHSHQIINAPQRANRNSAHNAHPHRGQHRSDHHPPHVAIHRRLQPPPATLPEANRRETWKTPYSYGYFGASAKRHWSLHHGYRDRYTQWQLR